MMIKGRPKSQRQSESLQVRLLNPYQTSLSLFSVSVCLNQVFPLSPFTGSPHYSEDFEEEENEKEPLEEVCNWNL